METPGGDVEVEVVLLECVPERGWAAFLTDGEKGVGGWAAAEGIHAVLLRYSAGEHGEDFRVGLLSEEARSELPRFPSIMANLHAAAASSHAREFN